jgi:hypothetical protein
MLLLSAALLLLLLLLPLAVLVLVQVAPIERAAHKRRLLLCVAQCTSVSFPSRHEHVRVGRNTPVCAGAAQMYIRDNRAASGRATHDPRPTSTHLWLVVGVEVS